MSGSNPSPRLAAQASKVGAASLEEKEEMLVRERKREGGHHGA
jgi:hypothetical protein